MPDQEELEKYLPKPDEVTHFERKLKREWRSLLLEDTDSSARATTEKSSYLFRPRVSSALELDIDPETLVRRAGDTLGDFQLERLIGQGAMGQVWEAQQVSLQRQVALKLIRPDRITPDLLRYFRREGRAGGRLQHPGIVAVFAMGQTEGVHWIAQELVEGECTFHSFLNELQGIEDLPGDYDRRIALFFYQLAEALQFAHHAGVIHRDLKPQNVLVTRGDRPKISDFGVARILDEGTLTQAGGLQGTPRYMSPEQVLGVSENIGPASDQFSLGAMFYRALTLENATKGNTLHAVLHAVTKVTPPKLTKIRPEMSRDLEAIVMRTIEKLPQDRYASLLEFQKDLGNYLDGRATAARQVGIGERALKWVRRNPIPSTTAAVLLVLAGVIATLFWALGDSREQKTLEAYRADVSEGRRHLERGESALAMASFRSAAELRRDAPESRILLASIAARGARYREAERYLEEAEALGFEPTEATSDDAYEQYLRGLYLFARGRQPRYEEAAVALTRAIELDETLRDAWYPLYQIRAAQLRHDEAASALREYMKGLTIGDPQARLASALLAEEEDDLESARDQLVALVEESEDQDEETEFLQQRSLGRVSITLGEFEEAVHALETAVAIEPRASDSLVLLAHASLKLAIRSDGAEREGWLRQSENAATEALRVETEPRDSLRLLAEIEYRRGNGEGGASREALRLHDPEDEGLLALEAGPILERADEHWKEGNFEAAVQDYQAVIDLGLQNITAHTMIANDLSFVGTSEADREALQHLDRAFAKWMESLNRRSFVRLDELDIGHHWRLQVMLVTRFVVAARQNEIATAKETKTALEDFLLDTPFISHAERLTYAEALVHNVPDGLRDAERARELLEEFRNNPKGISKSAEGQYMQTLNNILSGLAPPGLESK